MAEAPPLKEDSYAEFYEKEPGRVLEKAETRAKARVQDEELSTDVH